MTEALRTAPASVLRALAAAVRTGQLRRPYTEFAIRRLASCEDAVILAMKELGSQVAADVIVADILELAALASETSRSRLPYELVWTGPEHPVSHSRDTAVVVRELFSTATRSVLVSGYAIFNGREVLKTLAANMDANPALQVRLFLNIGRPLRDARAEAELVREFGDRFKRKDWPGPRLPLVYYDPRALSSASGDRAVMHAKCLIVDDARALVTSANLTGAAQYRNVEAGVLIDDPGFAAQLRRQFDALVAAKHVRRIPGIAEGE